MIALAEHCMADYDENGWTGDTWLNPDDMRARLGQACIARGVTLGSLPSMESTTLRP